MDAEWIISAPFHGFFRKNPGEMHCTVQPVHQQPLLPAFLLRLSGHPGSESHLSQGYPSWLLLFCIIVIFPVFSQPLRIMRFLSEKGAFRPFLENRNFTRTQDGSSLFLSVSLYPAVDPGKYSSAPSVSASSSMATCEVSEAYTGKAPVRHMIAKTVHNLLFLILFLLLAPVLLQPHPM